MKNIELFDTYTAQIFAQLYEKFPVETHLEALKISGCPEIDDFGMMHPKAEVCRATMEWLKESGYVRCKSANEYALMDVVLTAKGLEVLKAMPESLSGKVTAGEHITKLVKAGSMDLAREAAKVVVSHGVKMLLAG